MDEQTTAPTEQAREETTMLLELLTPIVKSWSSQWGQEANSLALQVHGGYGYTRDFNVELYYRDQRLNPIHEGTHGIQALDLLGRKVRLHEGKALALFEARLKATCAGVNVGFYLEAQALLSAFEQAKETITVLYGAENLDITLGNATAFLEAFGHIVVAWIWLEQANGCNEKTGDFYAGKRQAAKYFFAWELPKVKAMLATLQTLDNTALEMKEEWF